MRSLHLVLCCFSLLPSGCASLIARTGVNAYALETREEVHQKFGKPMESWQAGDESFEVFHTRRKLADGPKAVGLAMYTGMTWGVGELDALPYELFVLADGTVRGQEVRFDYDDSGKVTRVYVPERGFGVIQTVKDLTSREPSARPPPSEQDSQGWSDEN